MKEKKKLKIKLSLFMEKGLDASDYDERLNDEDFLRFIEDDMMMENDEDKEGERVNENKHGDKS